MNKGVMENKFYSDTKLVKLKVHPRSFSQEDLIVNLEAFSKDKFQLFETIIVEIFAPEDAHENQRKHLLLEVKALPLDIQAKGSPLSIGSEVAHAFKLNGLKNVCIRRVDKKEVGLDMVEVRFKDQTMTRSDMWRFTQSLIGKGMYYARKLEFIYMRGQVTKLWAQGKTVRSGVVVDSTRLVFRSMSAQLFLGIQISSEMWEFDPQGDIYFDKAVDGFLKTLFKEWKVHQCNHKVTLFLFARQYYKLTGRPMDLTRPSILRDKKGRYYEDIYDVIIDEEARDDWQSITMEVKKSFLRFQKLLRPDMPAGSKNGWHVSSSVDGNILESINMAVNVFEHHYIDSSFTTTGQQVVIVSPGVGVFEVEYELNRLTKERIIDFGVGVDLVCLNEQPLHAVPLFRYQQRHVQQDDQYYIPHWINYSFFNPLQRWMRYQFHPTIKMSDALINKHLRDEDASVKTPLKTIWSRSVDLPDPLARVDYDEYDDSIFSFHSSVGHSSALQSTSGINFTCDQDSRSTLFGVGTPKYPDKSKKFDLTDQLTHSLIQPKPRHHSDNYDQRSIIDSHLTTLSSSITETQPTTGLVRVGSAEDTRFKNGQAGNGGPRKKKSFINPFDPSKVHMEDSSHQHRWMHAFPRDSLGQAFQTHHVSKQQQQLEVVDENSCLSFSSSSSLSSGSSSSMNGLSPSPMNQRTQPSSESTPSDESLQQRRRKKSSLKGPASRKTSVVVGSFATVRRNGIDLPSLLEPASLPLTTDYFPEDNVLNNNYVQYPGTVTVNNYGNETTLDNKPSVALMRSERPNITPVEAFKEMISQRLSQGFQLVFTSGNIFSLHHELDELTDAVSSKSRKRKRVITVQFSLSRVFQVIRLNYPDILTYMYRAKKPLGIRPFHYHYRLKCSSEGAADSDLVSSTSCWFSPVMMEKYNWNYLDQHICGYEDFEEFQESNKYWRCRLLLLPFSLPSASASPEANTRWVEDIICGFVRFVEFLNHIKRGSQGAIKRQSSVEDSVGSVQRFGRASLPVSPSPRAYSPSSSPSPSPVFGRSRLSETLQAPATPNRSSSEPSGKAITIQGKKVARPSLPNMRASHRSATQRQPRTNRQMSLTQSATNRSRQDIVDSLRQLTVSPSSQRTPSPKIRGRRQKTIETDSVMEEDEDSLPTGFNIVPPSPLRLHSAHFDDGPSSPERESEELTLLSSPTRILQELLDPDDGVDLLGHQSGLKSNCFVAMEAVRWLMERLSDAITRAEAVKILQKLVTESLIVHASGNKAIPFIDGFFLYCLCADQRGKKSEVDWETYRKSWFEVKIHSSSLSGGECERNADTAPSSFQSGGSPYYMDYKDEEKQELERSFYLVELNPDTQAVSDRPEWCCVRYSSMFHHMTGFELEFQWIATTASLLKKMIQGWNYKAALCQFNLVPVPSMAMLKGDDDGRLHPFREPIFIPIRLSDHQGPNAPEQCARIFETILNRFGFLVDPASLPSEAEMSYLPKQLDATSLVYVHHSGCALVQPVTDDDSDSDITPRCSFSDSPTTPVGPSRPVSLGLNWFKNNLYLRQKSTPANMLTKHDSLFSDVKRFCNENTEDLAKLCPNIFP